MDGTYGINTTHLNISTFDIFSDHFYPPNNTKLEQDIALVETVNKVYLAGEYDWTGNDPQADSLQSFYSIIEGRQNMTNPVIAGDSFWSLFMHDVGAIDGCSIFVNRKIPLSSKHRLSRAHKELTGALGQTPMGIPCTTAILRTR